MENRKKIDDLFKNELGGYTETPPPAVWDALESKLDAVPIPSWKPRLPFIWLGGTAIVVLVLLTGYVITNHNNGNLFDTNHLATVNNSATIDPTVLSRNNNGTHITNGQNKPTENAGTQTTANNTPQATEEDNDRQKPMPTQKTAKLTTPRITTGQSRLAIAANKKHHKTRSVTKNAESEPAQEAGDYADAIPQEHVYNSSSKDEVAGKPEPEENKNNQEQQVVSKEPTKTVITPPALHEKPRFRFEIGVKGGYEAGFNNDAAKKGVLAPYIQYNISKKFAIMLQPAVKAASLGSRTIGQPRTYYRVNNDGKLYADSTKTVVSAGGPPIDSFLMWTYTYTQTHDSIVKTNVTGGTYVEIELPVLLKYNITPDFSVYGGVNILYSKLIGLTEQTFTEKAIIKTAVDNNGIAGPINGPAPTPPSSLYSDFSYTGLPYSSYNGPQYAPAHGYQLHIGYTIGFSYEFTKRWLFDALIQESPVKQNLEGGYNTNTTLSATYFRLTLGYKIMQLK